MVFDSLSLFLLSLSLSSPAECPRKEQCDGVAGDGKCDVS